MAHTEPNAGMAAVDSPNSLSTIRLVEDDSSIFDILTRAPRPKSLTPSPTPPPVMHGALQRGKSQKPLIRADSPHPLYEPPIPLSTFIVDGTIASPIPCRPLPQTPYVLNDFYSTETGDEVIETASTIMTSEYPAQKDIHWSWKVVGAVLAIAQVLLIPTTILLSTPPIYLALKGAVVAASGKDLARQADANLSGILHASTITSSSTPTGMLVTKTASAAIGRRTIIPTTCTASMTGHV